LPSIEVIGFFDPVSPTCADHALNYFVSGRDGIGTKHFPNLPEGTAFRYPAGNQEARVTDTGKAMSLPRGLFVGCDYFVADMRKTPE